MKTPNDPTVPGAADPLAPAPDEQQSDSSGSRRAERPQRRARLTIAIDADTPEELLRSLKRAVSRITIGCENWCEATDVTTGLARLRIDPDALAGAEFVAALEDWEKKQPRRKAR